MIDGPKNNHPTITIHEGSTADTQLDAIAPVYQTVYAEDPYREGPDDVARFRETWTRRTSAPQFRLVTAKFDDSVIGFCFGHELEAKTKWWHGAHEDLGSLITTEWPGRTFAIIELAILPDYRRQGIGRRLHAHILAGSRHERATLLVSPDATAAVNFYEHAGYLPLCLLTPFTPGPTYRAMVLPLSSPHVGARSH
jgi:ribosomal protein S18 acetylase RimI-like enzyme